MSTPEQIVDETIDDTDLDAFNDLFHGKTKEAPKDDGQNKDADKEDNESDAPTELEETQEDDEDDANLAQDDDEEDEAPAPKPKSRAEKRIEQLLEAERLAKEEVARLKSELEKRKEPEAPKATGPSHKDDKAPHPDDKNEDGTDKYPLGMFDEAYQDDRFNYMKEKFVAEQREALEREAEEAKIREAQNQLTAAWNEKLDPARERYPDFTEKGEELLETFADLDPAYGEYLTATIMSMDHGPDVLYFLSSNIDEAERIVKLGPQKATIALGRIEAQFDRDDVGEKAKPRPKVSKATPPPPRNRGSNAATPEVTDDTDDLDAFSAKLFKR